MHATVKHANFQRIFVNCLRTSAGEYAERSFSESMSKGKETLLLQNVCVKNIISILISLKMTKEKTLER